jgi:sec-independent protein translocase protein TatA
LANSNCSNLSCPFIAKGIKSFKKGMATDITDESEPEPKNVSENNQDSKDKE